MKPSLAVVSSYFNELLRRGIATASVAILCAPIWAQTPDFNGDGVVDFADFFQFADKFGQEVDAANIRFDLNNDDMIGYADLFIFADHFGEETHEPVPVGEVEVIGRIEE